MERPVEAYSGIQRGERKAWRGVSMEMCSLRKGASGQIQPEAGWTGATPGNEAQEVNGAKLSVESASSLFPVPPCSSCSVSKSYGSDPGWRIGENTDSAWNKVMTTGFNHKAAAKPCTGGQMPIAPLSSPRSSQRHLGQWSQQPARMEKSAGQKNPTSLNTWFIASWVLGPPAESVRGLPPGGAQETEAEGSGSQVRGAEGARKRKRGRAVSWGSLGDPRSSCWSQKPRPVLGFPDSGRMQEPGSKGRAKGASPL